MLQGATLPPTPQTRFSRMPEPQHDVPPPGPLSQFHAPQKFAHAAEQHFVGLLGCVIPPYWPH